MDWEHSGVVRFDLGPPLQGQTRIAKLKSAYNSLIIRGVTVPDFLVRDFVNAKPSRFRDTEKVHVSAFPQSNRPTNRK